MRVDGRVAVITGAARGIGFACAERFANEGARVVLVDRDAAAVEEAAATLSKRGAEACFIACDVGMKAEVKAMVETAERAHGRIDILINNAGTSRPARFLDLSEEDFDSIIRTNLKSVFLCSQSVARGMVARGNGGCIINMSSINAVVAQPTGAAYATSKGGINQLTKVMAVDLAPYAIRVNAVGPGTIVTELTRRNVLASEDSRRTILSRTPLRRCGEPAEVASVALFLASQDASYVTGQTIYPDGGRLALNYTVPVD